MSLPVTHLKACKNLPAFLHCVAVQIIYIAVLYILGSYFGFMDAEFRAWPIILCSFCPLFF